MDVLSHFFIPYVAALFALGLHRAPRQGLVDVARRESLVAHAVVFGLAGFSPDLDSLFSWASHFGSLYWLQHRGVSHTFLFAPLFGLATTFALHGLAVWRPARWGRFSFRPSFVPVAVLGAWTHLLLDLVTYTGIPLWWPFSFVRPSFPFFHYIVVWMFPVLAVVLGLHLWGKLRTPHVARIGVVVLVVLVVLAGVRDHYRPDVEDGFVAPRSALFEWTVVRPVDGGYEVLLYERGHPVEETQVFYPDSRANGTDAAIRSVQETPAYQGFRMGLVGPVATVAFVDVNGTTWVTFTDVAARFEATHGARWTPTDPYEAWGYVSFRIDGGEVTVQHRGW